MRHRPPPELCSCACRSCSPPSFPLLRSVGPRLRWSASGRASRCRSRPCSPVSSPSAPRRAVAPVTPGRAFLTGRAHGSCFPGGGGGAAGGPGRAGRVRPGPVTPVTPFPLIAPLPPIRPVTPVTPVTLLDQWGLSARFSPVGAVGAWVGPAGQSWARSVAPARPVAPVAPFVHRRPVAPVAPVAGRCPRWHQYKFHLVAGQMGARRRPRGSSRSRLARRTSLSSSPSRSSFRRFGPSGQSSRSCRTAWFPLLPSPPGPAA